jgi:CheY-like chemotaxis protein
VNLDFRTTFLVLEDDANDAILIRRAFTNAACRAFVCRNTSEARAYLLGAGMYSNRDEYPFPDIFVTDLHLGEESGINFLEWLRSREDLKDIPVIVLSGLISPKDSQKAKQLGVSRILQKPGNPAELQLLVLKLSNEFCPPRHATRGAARPQSQSQAA